MWTMTGLKTTDESLLLKTAEDTLEAACDFITTRIFLIGQKP
jgi:hypothetical protein